MKIFGFVVARLTAVAILACRPPGERREAAKSLKKSEFQKKEQCKPLGKKGEFYAWLQDLLERFFSVNQEVKKAIGVIQQEIGSQGRRIVTLFVYSGLDRNTNLGLSREPIPERPNCHLGRLRYLGSLAEESFSF